MVLEIQTEPLVSVITPVLNQQDYIEQTLQSVLNQDYPNIEYLVIDGGSTDGTLEILESYVDRITLISEPDEGQADAINKGFRLSRGEITTWLNADDVYLPGAVSAVVDAFAEDIKAVCIYGDCSYVNTQGEVLSRYPAREFDLRRFVVESENFIPQPAAFFRRECLEKAGSLDVELDFVLDYELWLRFAQVGKFSYLSQELAQARLHPEAKSVASFAKFGEELVEVIEAYYKTTKLALNLRGTRDEAVSKAGLRAAHAAFWAGDLQSAYQYSKIAKLKHLPLRKKITHTYIQGLSLLDHLGFPVGRFVRGSKKNPYTLFKNLGEN
ncbi:MAG: glycosyltransferase family 2 protein [Chloroflexota bacterium]